MLNGSDLSHWNATFDAKTFKAGGWDFVFHKATQGNWLTDPNYAGRKALALANGVRFGAYHFLDGSASGTEQADYFLKVVKPDGTFALMLDFESGEISAAEAFVSLISEETGVHPLVYTRASLILELIGNQSTILSNDPLFIATYGPTPIIPSQWSDWMFWQHSNGQSGVAPFSAPGIGPCDTDWFDGNEDELNIAWASISGKLQDPPAEVFTPQEVIASGLNVRSAPIIVPTNIVGNLKFGDIVLADTAHLTNGFAQRQDKTYVFARWLTPYTPPPTPTKLIDVPYHNQWAADATHYRRDCGPACVHMLLDWQAVKAGKPVPNITTDLLSSETSLSGQDAGLFLSEVQALAQRNGLALDAHSDATVPNIQAQIDAGNPVLLLIGYSALLDREDIADLGLHFVVVAGYDDTNLYINDPDYQISQPAGRNHVVPKVQIDAALKLTTTHYQGLFIGQNAPPPVIQPPSGWTMPIKATDRGVHASAGGWTSEQKYYDLAQRNGVKTAMIVAYMADQAVETIAKFRAAGVTNFIIRPEIQGPKGDVNDFVAKTQPIVQAYADAVGGTDGLMVVIGNEPQADHEGFGRGWTTPLGFNNWWLAAASLYRRDFPGIRLGFAPMTPLPVGTGDVRVSQEDFVAGCATAIAEADWVAVHSYWASDTPADYHPQIDLWRQQFGSKPLVCTENGVTNATQKISTLMVLASYAKFAAIGVSVMSWILDGTNVFNNGDWWINGINLSAPPPPPPVIVPPIQNTTWPNLLDVGIHHFPGGDDNWTLSLATDLHAKGKGLFVKLGRSGGGWSNSLKAQAIKQVCPESLVVSRWYDPNGWENVPSQMFQGTQGWYSADLTQMGHDYMIRFIKEILPLDADLRHADFLQVINEPTVGTATGSFWMGAMPVAEAEGLRLMVLCTPVFHPGLPGEFDGGVLRRDSEFWHWQSTLNMLRYAKAHGHAVGFDAYLYPDYGTLNDQKQQVFPLGSWTDPGTLLRHEQAQALLPADLQDILMLGLEWATFGASDMSWGDFQAGLKVFRALNKHLKAFGLWTNGLEGAAGRSQLRLAELGQFIRGLL